MPNGNLVMGPPTDPELEQQFPPIPGATLLTRDPRGAMFPENASLKQSTSAKPWERNWETPTAKKPWERNWETPSMSLMESLKAGAKQIIPELKGYAYSDKPISLEQAVQKAREELGATTPGISQYPWQATSLGAEPVIQMARDVASGKAWEDVKKYIATKPVEAGLTALTLATPFPEAAAVKAGEAGAVETAGKLLGRKGLKEQAVEGIEGAKQSGLSFKQSGVTPVLSDIRSKLSDMGYDAQTHARVARALGHLDRLLAKQTTTPEMEDYLAKIESPKRRAQVRLQIMDQGPGHTFKDIHNAMINLRPAIKAEGTEGAMGEMMQEKLDDYVLGLPKGPEFQKGIAEYSQARKLDEINAIKERVETATQRNKTRAGYAHNLALEVDKIARNPKKLRLWKPDEQKYITSIVRKGNLAQKIAGALGNFAPSGIGRIGIDVVLGHILGSVIPGGTYGLMAMGAISRGIETKLAKKRLGEFEKIVAAGGSEEDLAKFRNLVSPSVSSKLESNPATKQALLAWSNAKGKARKTAARGLAVAIARQSNTPTLVPRIEKEVNDLDNPEAQ